MSHSPNQMLSGVYVSLEDGEPRLACTQTSMRRTPKKPTLRTAVDREGNRNCLLPVTPHVNWDHARYHPNFRGCTIRNFKNSINMCKLHTWTNKDPCETTISFHPWPNSPKTLLPSKLQLIWCHDHSCQQAAIKIHKGTTREQQLATPSESHLTQHPPVAADHWHIHLVGSSVDKAEESTWEMVCLPWQEKKVNKWHWLGWFLKCLGFKVSQWRSVTIGKNVVTVLAVVVLQFVSHPFPHITPFPNQGAHEPQGEAHHHRHREEGKHIEPASLFPGIGKHQDSRSWDLLPNMDHLPGFQFLFCFIRGKQNKSSANHPKSSKKILMKSQKFFHEIQWSHIGIQHGHDRSPQGRTLRIAASLQQHGSVRGVAFKFGGKPCRGEGMEHEFIRFFVHLFICFLRPPPKKRHLPTKIVIICCWKSNMYIHLFIHSFIHVSIYPHNGQDQQKHQRSLYIYIYMISGKIKTIDK